VKNYAVGDHVVYHKPRHCPPSDGRSWNICASRHGDAHPNKYWIVSSVLTDGMIEVMSAKWKVHPVKENDTNLRKASFIERLLFWHRFPPLPKIRNVL
jgi:hypothetical protein